MSREQKIRVVSFRRVFRTDWRLTRVWEFDLTKLWPGGIPVVGALWVVGAMVFMYGLSHVPPTSYVVGQLPSWFRYGTFAVLIGVWSQQESPDGRSIHAYATARIKLLLRRPERAERKWLNWSTDMPVKWDASSTELKRCRVVGPAKVTVNAPAQHGRDQGKYTIKADLKGAAGVEYVLGDGDRMEVYA